MKNTNRTVVVFAYLAMCLAALPAAADEFKKTIQAGDKPEISVLMRSANVKIESTDGSAVEVRSIADISRGIEVKGSEIRISYKSRQGDEVAPDKDLHLLVPKTTRLVATTVSGELTLTGSIERAKLTTVSGDLTIEKVTGQTTLKTVSGDIVIGSSGGDLTIGSVSGDIKGGSITGKLAELHTVSGEITLDKLGSEQVRLKTVSGDMTIGVVLTPQSTFKIATVSGDAQLRLPAGAGFNAALNSRSGSLSSDFEATERDSHQLKVGSGGADIEMKSLSGDLKIVKAR